ncbi:MAG: DinB family protein [Treponema sp.]|nr:DinB family protein [Treponema sp.]
MKTMKETCLMFARYHKAGNQAVLSILQSLSPAEREKDRGSYYGSLSGLVRHIGEGTLFFQGLFKGALSHNAPALKALAAAASLTIPQDTTGDASWKALLGAFETLDEGLIQALSALDEEDFTLPVPIQWYGGNPDKVPLYFLLHQLTMHGTHHRGQISQVLDELKIPNDYSGINAAFLPSPALPR